MWIFFIPLAFQFVAFSSLGETPGFGAPLAQILHVASLLVAAVALALNRQLPGLLWIAAGLASNFVVIALNGGFMPVSAAAREFAGMPPLYSRDMNVIPMTERTILPWLGDILPLPAWLPFANVFSPGDVAIAIGGIIFIQCALKPPSSQTRVDAQS